MVSFQRTEALLFLRQRKEIINNSFRLGKFYENVHISIFRDLLATTSNERFSSNSMLKITRKSYKMHNNQTYM